MSIDFEDFHHDLKRSLGICKSGSVKVKELWNKYEKINGLLNKYGKGKGKFATFFCTGILAEKEPSLISQISRDGHEVACHYFFHDVIKNENNETLYRMLLRAKESLEKVSQSEVKGFRAPYFAINKNSPQQYKIVEKVFKYDSSYHSSSLFEVECFKKRMELTTLKIIPLYSSKKFGFSFKLGGTFLKIFPQIYSKMMFNNSINAGFTPHIYLHPYEFGNAKDFRIRFCELKELGLRKACYWKIRQNQWLSFQNRTTKNKLENLITISPLEGKLCNI